MTPKVLSLNFGHEVELRYLRTVLFLFFKDMARGISHKYHEIRDIMSQNCEAIHNETAYTAV